MGIDDVQQQAAELRSSHAEAVEEVRADPDLTPDAKERRIRDLTYESERGMQKLRERAEQERQGELDELRRGLVRPTYPNGSTVSDRVVIDRTYQEYLDRGLAAGRQQLADLIVRAFAAGNWLMKKALLEAAFLKGDGAAIDAWAQHDPSSAEKIERLVSATNRERSADTKFRRRMEFSVPSGGPSGVPRQG